MLIAGQSYNEWMKLISLLLFSLVANAAEQIKIKEIHCFVEKESAQKTFQKFSIHYGQRQNVLSRLGKSHPPLDLELVHDGKDTFGRTHCLITKSREFTDQERETIKKHQLQEDKTSARKTISTIKDPWGGKAVDLSGKPKIMRVCEGDQTLHCEDLIITALLGEEDVIEYRFWLGARSGEGLVVHKSSRNALELTKVMNQLKKDKENFSYSFSPKDQSAFVKDAQIGGN